jgi:hypothetical protein
MIQIIILSISLGLGAVLYIALSRRVANLEKHVDSLYESSIETKKIMLQLAEQLNKLTNAHNEVADYLNNHNRQSKEEYELDSYSPFKTPHGEA